MVFPGERNPFPFHFAVRVSRASVTQARTHDPMLLSVQGFFPHVPLLGSHCFQSRFFLGLMNHKKKKKSGPRLGGDVRTVSSPRVSRADYQFTWTYTCRCWERSTVIILPQRRQLQNYLKRDLAELENYLWAQVQSKSSKKILLSIRAQNATDGKKLDSPFHWQSKLCHFHPPSYILVWFYSFLRQRRHALLKVGVKSSFFDTFGYFGTCSQKDLSSSFWWDEFEVEFWACVYLKMSARHLQCLLSLSALLVALRLFNVLVSLS